MTHPRVSFCSALVLAAVIVATIPAAATTLVRRGLEQLVDDNELVVQGKVLDIHSYWNADHSFILTDVHVRPTQVLKGPVGALGDVTFTVLGGAVGDVTIVLVGGPELVPGSEYLLFLAHDRLPGAANPLTTRDHAQGVFDLASGRAVSQAIGEPLLPDAEGRTDAVGGDQGVGIEELLTLIRKRVGH